MAQVLNGFFESAVDISGLQRAAPPVGMFMGQYETDLTELYYRYPTMPMPPMAGGLYGTAPVYAAEVSFDLDEGRWTVTDDRFDTAGAMHTANEMIWFHFSFFGSGFPVVQP